jgi:predicted permease
LLLKERWFTAVVIGVLALGLAVNTAVFTLVNAVLIRDLPFDKPDLIVSMGMVDNRGRNSGVSWADFQDWRDAARSFEGMSAMISAPMNVSDDERAAEQFSGVYNSANTFSLVRQQPIIGRDFTAADDRLEAEPVAILGNGVWKSRYGGDAAILGKGIRINGRTYTVVGVMGPDMKFPFNTDIWIPFAKLPPETLNAPRNARGTAVFGRLASGVSIEQGRAELTTIASRLAQTYPDTNKDVRPTLITWSERATGPQIRLVFLSLMGAVAFVLLIACANVANLLLARSAQRAREVAVRVSLGASRWRIVRQLLLESVLLSVIAGALGLALAVAGIRWFDSVTTDVGKPYWMTFTLDARVFGFLALICIATGIVFGLAPALHITKTDVNEVLKDSGGRSASGGVRARRWTGALIVVEIALTLVLLGGAGYMMRSFLTLYRMDVGMDTSHLLTMNIYLPLTRYPRPESRATVIRQMEERLHGVSALQASAMTTSPPLMGGFVRRLTIAGRPDAPRPEERPEVTMVAVTPGYFETIGMQLTRGRPFDAADGTPGHESVIVNERLVAMHFAGEDPIGRQITLFDAVPSQQQSPPRTATVVGVTPTIRQRSVDQPLPDPVVYLPYQSDPQRGLVLVVRAIGEPGRITSVVREEMRAVEPDLPLFNIMTMDQSLARMRWPFRVFGSMFAIFAAIALALSAVGLYAVTAYSVTQRAPEIGVRMALGAKPQQVMWLVLRRGLLQLAIGLPIGVAGAFGVGQLLRSILVQNGGRDVTTIVAIAAVMIGVSVFACFWPAQRATRLDPLAALRYE